MKADRSRDTFDPTKHYRRVLHQQGRVVLDADDNEQVSIDLATSERTISDVIGQAGVPEVSLSTGYPGGFAIGIGNLSGSSSSSSSSSSSLNSSSSSNSSSSASSSSGSLAGTDLTITHGRIYVDGILVINDSDTTLFTQPFLPLDPSDTTPAGLAGAGLYAVYLDVWERVVTPLDDPEIVETALGGPDTCLRTQVAWQVRLGQIDTAKQGNNPECSQIAAPWPLITQQGLLTAGLGARQRTPCRVFYRRRRAIAAWRISSTGSKYTRPEAMAPRPSNGRGRTVRWCTESYPHPASRRTALSVERHSM
jgi:hypothetical protein